MAMAFSSVAEVRASVPDHIFKRAKEIASSHKLRSLTFHGPPLLQKASATCSGSNPGDSYDLSISIGAESLNKPVWECSCPAALKTKGTFCKHVVALLILRVEELIKITKKQENESILSEFKQVEDRLAEDKTRECSTADSQATEPLPSNEMFVSMAEVDSAATGLSELPNIKKNHKRVLPPWMSEGYIGVKKEANANVARTSTKKTKKRDTSAEQEDDHSNKEEPCTINSRKTNGIVDGKSSKRVSRVQKRKKTVEETSQGDEEFVDENNEQDPRKNISQTHKGPRRQRNVKQIAKKRSQPILKKRKTNGLIESDLSEESEPENTEFTSNTKDDLDLTSEDLVNLAKEHLELENGSDEYLHQPRASAAKSNDTQEGSPPKTKGSMFSVKGWNQMVTKSVQEKNPSFGQENSGLFKSSSQISEELHLNPLPLSAGNVQKTDLKPVETVVDDMLGLFFGPSLSKAASSKSGRDIAVVEDFSTPNTTFPSLDTPDIMLPVNVDSAPAPMPKKKGSLKDKVMMYLG